MNLCIQQLKVNIEVPFYRQWGIEETLLDGSSYFGVVPIKIRLLRCEK